MFLRLARDIAKPHTFAILDLLKRSTGLSVNELAKAMKMSYMGVKQHCIDLEKKGFLDTWRRPGEVGRPEKVYRLTAKAGALYPEAGNELCLEILQAIQKTYGPTAPDKLLFNVFSKKVDVYLKKVKGRSAAERATSFAKIRNSEGHCSGVEYDPQAGFRIVEYHSPLKEIANAFPNIRLMEAQMFQKVLLTDVVRTEERVSGLTKYVFAIPTLGHAIAS